LIKLLLLKMVKLQVYRCLIFVVIAFMIHGANTSFANSELTLAGAIESDPASKEKELLVKFRHKDKEEKFLNKLSLKIDHGYLVNNGVATKNKELFDYEHNLQIFRKEQKSFVALYFRHKDDNFNDSVGQNYNIFSAGYGVQKKHKDEKVALEYYLGQRHNSEGDIIIMRPVLSYENIYKKFLYSASYSIVKGDNFKVIQNKFSISYPLSKTISLKYLLEYERSKDQNGNDFDKINKIALSIKLEA